MKTFGFFGIVAAVSLATSPAQAQNTKSLPRSSPESQGVSTEGLTALVTALDQKVKEIHSIMVVRHGKVVLEAWWNPQTPDTEHIMWSLSKSFTSTAVGLAVAEGKLSVDDEVLKFFPEDAPSDPSANLKMMRVRDLLRMNTGHDAEAPIQASKDKTWVKTFLEQPVVHKPGTRFLYNTPATYMLSAIVHKVTGKTVFDYLSPRLFEPLGIEGAHWDQSPQGINLGGYGLFVRTEDVAKLGLLYLQKGRWSGKQILPEAWVADATTRQTSNGSNPNSDWDQGYCYQFWRCRHNGFRGDGAAGQFCIVLPDEDTVIAITAKTGDMQSELNVVWDNLLPALHKKSLPTNSEATAKLKGILGKLSISDRIRN
ncbi:MAG: serine hydrolase [Chthonomonadales bacterium]